MADKGWCWVVVATGATPGCWLLLVTRKHFFRAYPSVKFIVIIFINHIINAMSKQFTNSNNSVAVSSRTAEINCHLFTGKGFERILLTTFINAKIFCLVKALLCTQWKVPEGIMRKKMYVTSFHTQLVPSGVFYKSKINKYIWNSNLRL